MTDWLEEAEVAVDELCRGNTFLERLEYWDELAAYCAANAQGIREDHDMVMAEIEEDDWDGWEGE